VPAPSRVGTEQTIALVEGALASLSAEQREVVLLHKLEGLSMEEIAGVLGVSAGAIRVRAHRGYKAIASYLEENGG
jgi:RNA polymerase sigma-70 factor (ECF subfamily)